MNIDRFVELFIKKGNADGSGQYNIGNECYDLIIKCYNDIKINDEEDELLSLINHKNCNTTTIQYIDKSQFQHYNLHKVILQTAAILKARSEK
ncbi:hypothetical protein [Ruminococcus sp.]|uniref:hypothetical protein n=1 Tax=Ruminococcus sp. TaxID=41978 RepID=UPI0025E836A7|nr:hypothetical protein [Ruminococcus sp.]MBQ8967247.1 hypothetical protein [Ruminococcus sp.]